MFSVQSEIAQLDPYMVSGNTGTLGRLIDSLSTEFNVNAFSVDTNLVALEGNVKNVPKTAVNSQLGFHRFNPSSVEGDVIDSKFDLINGEETPESNFFSQTWSSSLVSKQIPFFRVMSFYRSSYNYILIIARIYYDK